MTAAPTTAERLRPEHAPPDDAVATRTRLGRLVVVPPLLLAALVAPHPLMGSDPFVLADRLDLWLGIHLGQLALFPLLAWSAWHALAGLPGRLPAVGRLAVAVFLVFASAYDALAGVATGWLVRDAAALGLTGPDVQALVSAWWTGLNPHWLALVGGAAWAVASGAAAIGHHRIGSAPAAVWGLALGATFAILHGSIPASLALVAFAWGVSRARPAARRRP